MINGCHSSMIVLERVSFRVTTGEVLAVVGRVGSGKSSLLSALCGEMVKCGGSVALKTLSEGFGLVTQKPWIQRGTIRDNILFGSSLDIKRYREVIMACALEEDLDTMPFRDLTQCGENGSALSGGQRVRVALARAVYQRKPVYLFDDILSSLDPPVARHIMRHCVHGLLHGNTVIIASTPLAILSHVHWVVRLDSGRVVMQGSPSKVLPDDLPADEVFGEWRRLTNDSVTTAQRRTSLMDPLELTDHDDDDTGNTATAIRYDTSFEEDEDQAIGEIVTAVLFKYAQSVGVPLVLVIVLSLTLMQASRNLTDLWLAYWVTHDQSETNTTERTIFLHESPASWITPNMQPPAPASPAMGTAGTDGVYLWLSPHSTPLHKFLVMPEGAGETEGAAITPPSFFLTVYASLAGCNTMFTLMRAFFFAYGGITAARSLHTELLDTVLHAKMKFFDNNPLGRILNRFSTDMYALDDTLPFQANIFLAQFFGLTGALIVTIYSMPWIVLMHIPLGFVYFNVQHYYRRTSRDLKRIYAVSLSPLYAHFTETLNGLQVIRAMRSEHRFITRSDSLLEVSQRAQFDIEAAAQWLNMRLQLIGLTVLAGVSTLALVQHHFDAIEPGLIGLVISYALTLTSFLNAVVTSLSETEQEMVCMERVYSYLEGAEEGERQDGALEPPLGWISQGIIRFNNVYLRYQEHNPYALRRVTFEISTSEKVGIVGRTGAGKSSIFVALFRLVELCQGAIFVDGIDVSRLSLKKLRSHLAIVTQDSFLFTGSVRENLDPCGLCMDSEVWQAVQACHLQDVVCSLGGLEGHLHAAGRDLSAGERQLFCLARALLCRTKVVCIDEGTSRLDAETEECVQEVIGTVFRNKTVLIIAHRLHTVRDCDKVIVMSEGEVVEVGRPWELLANTKSTFYAMFKS